ncbi:hypothetical protein SNE40_018774 [Patella caerulea]|uniref:BRCA1-associated protein n=1 Tax=Patella caerulea TaxID=87958 RepID=A0AAN8J6N4_PATCE
MHVSLVLLRLEIANDSNFPRFLKNYSAPHFDLRSKERIKSSYASVVAAKPIHKHKNSEQHGERKFDEITLEFFNPKDVNLEDIPQAAVDMDDRINMESTLDKSEDGRNVNSNDLVNKTSATSSKDHAREDSISKEISLKPGIFHNTRPKSHSPTITTPLKFYYGNPSVELTKGILHIYKENHPTSLDDGVTRSEMICILAVPASYTIHDLLNFTAPMSVSIEHMQIIRDKKPNQYMVLMKFSNQGSCDEFYSYFNNRPFNSIEPDICHLVYVAQVEVMKESEGGSQPIPGVTELPNCPVCLERMEESVDGILTVLCNHAFHRSCLQKWGDTSCPVCRYIQTPEETVDNRCMKCSSHESLWICLICGHVGCGRYVGLHAYRHFQETNHTYAMQLGNNQVWDYAGDNYVHRLVQNKSDGKLVEVDEGGNIVQDEKLDTLTLEYTNLLTTQLDSQRLYFEDQMVEATKQYQEQVEELTKRWKTQMEELETKGFAFSEVYKEKQALERKCSNLHNRLTKALTDLQDEKQMNSCLRENQKQWQDRVAALESEVKKVSTVKDAEIKDLQDQLRDVMFYFEAQEKLANNTEISQEELQDGQVFLGASASASQAGKKPRKKQR